MRAGLFAVVALIAMASTEASTQVLNLSSPYRCVRPRMRRGSIGQPAFITQNGWDMRLVSEVGMPSRAWIDRPGHIWVDFWHEGAVYSLDGLIDPIWIAGLSGDARSRRTDACRASSFRGAGSFRPARPSGQRAPGPQCRSCADFVRKSAHRDQCLRRPLSRSPGATGALRGSEYRYGVQISNGNITIGRWRIH